MFGLLIGAAIQSLPELIEGQLQWKEQKIVTRTFLLKFLKVFLTAAKKRKSDTGQPMNRFNKLDALNNNNKFLSYLSISVHGTRAQRDRTYVRKTYKLNVSIK